MAVSVAFFFTQTGDEMNLYAVKLEVRIKPPTPGGNDGYWIRDFKRVDEIGEQKYVVLHCVFNIRSPHAKRAVDRAFEMATRKYVRVLRDIRQLSCELVNGQTGEIMGEGMMN